MLKHYCGNEDFKYENLRKVTQNYSRKLLLYANQLGELCIFYRTL